MIVIEFEKYHFVFTVRAVQRIITERRENGGSPLIETAINMVLASENGPMEFGVNFTMPGIKSAISNHFKMFFRDVTNQPLNEFHSRNGFFNVFFIFMAVVMKGNHFAVIFINSGSGNNRAAQVTADIFDDCLRITDIWFCENIKPFFVIRVTFRFDFFEGSSDAVFHLVKQSGTKGIAKISVTKDFNVSPKSIITVAAFGNQAMDMRIPFEITSESV